MKTTFFTCCNKKYEFFIPIFLHSILYHNINVDIEIGVQKLDQDVNILENINYIKQIYKNSNIKLRIVNFGKVEIDNVFYQPCPGVVRFIETPSIKNDFIYISDIDIITLQKNIQDIHINDMNKSNLNYSNIVRPYTDSSKKRLTGLHFTKYDNYYPIPNFGDIANKLSHDEIFLHELVKKNNVILEKHNFRPVHGIHISLNRPIVESWEIKKWGKEWMVYRNSTEFLHIEKTFSVKLKGFIEKIDNYYKNNKK